MGLETLNRSNGQSRTVEVLPDLSFARFGAVDVAGTPSSGTVDVTMMLVFDEASVRYNVDSLTAYRRGPEQSVDSVALRTIPVQDLVHQFVSAVRITTLDTWMPERLDDDLVRDIKAAGPSDPDSLRWLARVYVVAHAFQRPPAKAVQDQLQMPTPTASVWIRRARDRGFIPEGIGSGATMSQEDYKLAKMQLRGFAD